MRDHHFARNQTVNGALIQLGRDGRVLWMSEPAGQWLNFYFPSELCSSSTLPETLRRWARQQSERLKRATAVAERPEPLTVQKDQRRLTVRWICEGDHARLLLRVEVRVLTMRRHSPTCSGRTVFPCVLAAFASVIG